MTCPLCGKPVLDGEPIYTIPDKDGKIRHYDCWDEVAGPAAKKALGATVESMRQTLNRIRVIAGRLK